MLHTLKVAAADPPRRTPRPPTQGVPIRRTALATESNSGASQGVRRRLPQHAPKLAGMPNDPLRQRRPNRRFARLLPAAVAAVTIAASAPFAATAHAETQAPNPTPHVHVTPPGKIAGLVVTQAAPSPRVQGNSTT